MSGPGCGRSDGRCRTRDRPRSSTVVGDTFEFLGCLCLVLFPHAGRFCQVVGDVRVIVSLLFVTEPPLLEQLPPGLAQLAEDRAQRVQALLNRLVRRGQGSQIVGCLLVVTGGFTQLGGNHVDSVCHPLSPSALPVRAGLLSTRSRFSGRSPAWWAPVGRFCSVRVR